MSDPYQQSNGTLKNKLGLTDPEALKRAEADLSALRASTLQTSGAFALEGFNRLRAIHGHLFGDVYDWAGQPRTVNIAKGDYEQPSQVTRFTEARAIPHEAERIFSQAAQASQFCGLSREEFAQQAADHFADINQLHAFREGNGRAQRLYIESVARDAGHELNFQGISHERMVAVSVAAARGDREPMRRMFDEISDPSRSLALANAAAFLEKNKEGFGVDWNDHTLATPAAGQRIAGDFVVVDGAGNHAIVMTRNARGYGDGFAVINARDLPNSGKGLDVGDHIDVVATLTPDQRAQQWLDRVDRGGTPGARAPSLEAHVANLRRDAAAAPMTVADQRAWARDEWSRQAGDPSQFAKAEPALMQRAASIAESRREARELLPAVEKALPRARESATLRDQAIQQIRTRSLSQTLQR